MIDDRSTVVVITAKDAAATAAHAVSTALRQLPVREVVFVDDGSRDSTADVAAASDDGSGRLKIIRLATNVGPARARNIAMNESKSSFICVLDADDYMAPERLDRLFDAAGASWDLVADDLFFTPNYGGDVFDTLLPQAASLPKRLDLTAFLAGNIHRKGRHRRELGFLKPLMRRSFLQANALCYDERVRLGEDLVLYAHCLLKGARFRVVEGCGYYAVERPGSLSGSHRTEDVAALHQALCELEDAVIAAGQNRSALQKLIRSTKNNLDFRLLLDAKREGGLAGAIAAISNTPSSIPYIARAILEAKFSGAASRLKDAAAGSVPQHAEEQGIRKVGQKSEISR